MKTARMLTILVLALGLVFFPVKLTGAAPMGTAFTYQGQLYDANYVANGQYDFAFKLYDVNVGGNKVGTDVNVADVDVIDGYFTVELDFGSGAFDGNAVWLEIGVRPGDQNDPNVYTVLSPRQEVTPTPYAIYADSSNWNNLIDVPTDIADGDDDTDTQLSEAQVDAYVANNGYLDTETDPTVLPSVKDGVSWGEVSSRPAGLDDGDDVGITSEIDPTVLPSVKDGVSWSEVSSRPAGLDDGDDVGITSESDTLSSVCSRGNSTSGSITVDTTVYSDKFYVSDSGNGNAVRVANTSSSSPTIWAKNYSSNIALFGETGSGNAIKAKSTGSSYPTVVGENTAGGYGGYFYGDLGCSETKTAVVETQSYGHRSLYTDESAEIYFFDRGQGQLGNGTCVINLDPMFLETVTINDAHPMLVQITLTVDCKGVFVSEKTNSSFTVMELQGGTSNATFDWEVAAKRAGYEDIRMEKITLVKEPQVEAEGAGIEPEVQDVESSIGRVRIIKGE